MFTESSSKAVGAPISATAHSRSIFDDCILEGKGRRGAGGGGEGEWGEGVKWGRGKRGGVGEGEEGKGKKEREGQEKGEGGGRVLTRSLFC